jgi:hypothetical protein
MPSDSGAEFINAPLLRDTRATGIGFTRARANKKNDKAYVEQKNKCSAKTRVGGNVRRRYDKAGTPYQRVRAAAAVAEDIQQQLRARYATLNPAELMRNILRLQHRLFKRTKKNNVQAGYQHVAQELWILHIYAHRRTPQCGLGYKMHAATFSSTFIREASRKPRCNACVA